MKTCPKCSYIRQATDTAPDYECPKCGIIYAKYNPEREKEKAAIAERVQAQRALGGAEPTWAAAPEQPAPSARPAQPQQPPPLQSRMESPPGPAPADANGDDLDAFAERLRADSRYPTFRELVKAIFFVWMALAALTALGGVVTLIRLWDFVGVGLFIISMFFAVLFVVIARISRELSLMLVDLSDAAVRIASRVRP